jgi:hypothetical protein
MKEECEICGERKAVLVCPVCGRKVCRECFDEKGGVCLACSSSLCRLCGRKPALYTCQVCGRPVCPDCSIKIDEIKPVCRECLNKYGLEGVKRIIEERIVSSNKRLAAILG